MAKKVKKYIVSRRDENGTGYLMVSIMIYNPKYVLPGQVLPRHMFDFEYSRDDAERFTRQLANGFACRFSGEVEEARD
jgi:hypothetical protein